ncbi:hypothetical protein D8682_04945 [Buttiauxella sp. 3AFRM03]|uniref:hypothetical protein n=1 Tax=Buttiauxella sp. 3AFRM03 TaxID=2479367 RepID=UPI000EF7DC38|nr:hypothetical protein [Buttiauxella sp. 3AFRM03]AYN26402.1 hypothetical protein D8682_04945 [Buttiauxella sp. 3AFRM03]
MGVVSSAFKSTVTFGGVVSSSFKSSQATLIDGIKKTTAESAKLTRQQTELTKKIKAGTAAGKDVSKLQKKYEALGKSISDANADAAKLNRTLKARKVWMTPLAGLSKHTGLTGLATGVAGGLSSRFSGIRERGVIPSALSAAGQNAGLFGALTTGLVGGAFAVNASTAEQAGVAKGYGVSLNKFKAWDAVGKQIGMSGEAFGDLAEELSNKIGEYKALGEMSAVSDAFKGLGIAESEISGKTNEEQMAFILNRAAQVKDEQVARSMVDMIMGGEGNKILAFMKLSGRTYEELMSAQEKYILTTKEGEEGAIRGQMAMSSMWTALSSAAQEVTGTLAGELAPSITKYADEFSTWFRTGGKDILVDGITGFATSISDFWTNQLSPVLASLWQGLQALAEKIQEWFPSVDVEVRRAKTGEEAYQIGWRESEESQRKYAENRGEDFVFDPGKARQDALAMMQKWEGIKSEQLFERATPLNERPAPKTADEKLLSFLNDTQAPLSPSGETQTPGITPLQQFPINVTVQSTPGDDAVSTGKKVAGEVFNILNPIAGGNSIMTPASLGG